MFEATQEEIRAVCAAARTAINVRLSPLLVQLQTLLGGICSNTLPKADNALAEAQDLIEIGKGVAKQANDLLGRLNAGATVEVTLPRQ